MLKLKKNVLILATLAAVSVAAQAEYTWDVLFEENFDASPTGWAYAGRQIGEQDLIRWNAAAGKLDADWDQLNYYDGATSPQTIVPSSYTKPLGAGMALTDADTFKFGGKIRVTSHSDNTAFYQIANFGLYNMDTTGPDRLMSDDFSGNDVPNANNFLEFNYFIVNDPDNFFGPFGPTTQATGGAASGALLYGSWSDIAPYGTNTDMGCGHWLPDEELYVEVTYFGAADDSTARRARSAVYEMVGNEKSLLSVNGVDQLYWTMALPEEESFTLTHAGFWNYAGDSWTEYGYGSGTYDDFYVCRQVPEPAILTVLVCGLAMLASHYRHRRG